MTELEIVVGADGAAAAQEAIASPGRTAVWVGSADDPGLEEMREELTRARKPTPTSLRPTPTPTEATPSKPTPTSTEATPSKPTPTRTT